MKNAGVLVILAAATLGYTQAPDTLWTKTFGGGLWDAGYCVRLTSDTGYIITGATESFGGGELDVFLIKTDANGDTAWTRTFGDLDLESGRSVQQTMDNGYNIAGYKMASYVGDLDVYLIKTDSSGTAQWTKTYGGADNDWAIGICETPDSGFIIVGTTVSFGAGYEDAYLLRTDKDGDTLWTRTFGWSGSDWGNSVALTPDSGYIITGVTYSTSNAGDIYVIKTDTSGNIVWTKIYGDIPYEWSGSIAVTRDSGYVVAGQKTISGMQDVIDKNRQIHPLNGQTVSSLVQNDDVLVLRLNAVGDTIWTGTFGGSLRDIAYSVQETHDGGYIIAGSADVYSYPYDADAFVLKTNADGDSVWSRIYGGSDHDYGYSVQQTPDMGYIVTGSTESFGAGDSDVWLLRMESDSLGVSEGENEHVLRNDISPTAIVNGPIILPEGKKYKVFDIMGRIVEPNSVNPGIYFIEVDGMIKQKVLKVR